MNDVTTQRWDDLHGMDREKFSDWMRTDLTGQAISGEAEGDMDYAVWLIAVELTCHQRYGKPYTFYPHADWHTSYQQGHTPGEAVTANQGALMNATTATGADPLAAARYAIRVASELDDHAKFTLGEAARQNPDDPNDIRAYLDPLCSIGEATRATLYGRGLIAADEVTVAWSTLRMRPLTRLGLLIHAALTKDGGHVIEGARIEIENHAEWDTHRAMWDAHRAEPGHDRATCRWAACKGEPCYWPMCELAEV